MPKKTAFVCRTNAPLLMAAFDLRKRCPSIRFRFLGKDIAKSLKDCVVEVLEWRRNVDIEEFQILLNSWIDQIRLKYKDKEGKEEYWAECEDKYSQVCLLSENCKDARGILEEIDNTFVDADKLDDDPNVVVFASGHRSKGLEWDRVIVIRYDLCPHPSAETAAEMEQEEHIKYIMISRPREQLWICSEKKPEPNPK